MIDVLDAYSRYLVHCQPRLTVRTEDVPLAVETALDTLPPERRRAGEPEIVHDCGSQFVGHVWAALVQATAMTDVGARSPSPIERLRRARAPHFARGNASRRSRQLLPRPGGDCPLSRLS